jgi:hypothetical protein
MKYLSVIGDYAAVAAYACMSVINLVTHRWWLAGIWIVSTALMVSAAEMRRRDGHWKRAGSMGDPGARAALHAAVFADAAAGNLSVIAELTGESSSLPVKQVRHPVVGWRHMKMDLGTWPPKLRGAKDAELAGAAQCLDYMYNYNPFVEPKTHSEPSPATGCNCGYFMLDEMPSLGVLWGGSIVTGPQGQLRVTEGMTRVATVLCRAWGKVIRHEKGFRCQYMQALALVKVPPEGEWIDWVPDYNRSLEAMGAALNLPVLTPDQALAMHREHTV